MRRAIRALACVGALLAALCAPALAAAANGQLAMVANNRLVTVNPDATGQLVVPLGDPQQVTELAWSPDGNRLALVDNGRIEVYDPGTGRVLTLTEGTSPDANIGWSPDSTRIGFRRGAAALTVPASGGAPQPHPLALPPMTGQLAWAPDLERAALVVRDQLVLPGPTVTTPPVPTGAPAWSPDGTTLAFADASGLATVPAAGGLVTRITAAPAGPPRWAPDARSLIYAAGSDLRTVAATGGESRVLLSATRSVGAADWQPCTAGVTVSCRSLAPPHCSVQTATATTQADQPVDLPAPVCADPGGRRLLLVIVRAPEHGTLAGLRYTPAPGFSGQDAVIYKLTNGVTESESVRVTVFIVPRPAAPVQAARPPAPAVRSAPFLTARATPRLDKHRRAVAQLSCDQDCSVSVRLSARLRSKRTLTGPVAKRSLLARQVLSVHLRLPAKPRGRIKTVWITGRVRNAAGDVRNVKLPVRLPR